ncbi:MAG: indolepyruvate oxidoreductase subunit beta [Deltaproteobacteria bacterium]|nr:indolepyruvate oxidoreductase subunit beta [Deltaproteobacteria bacterium]
MDVTRLIIVAVGGQGNLLASKVLGEASLCSGIPVRMSEIHGMAQRGGVVESALVFGDAESTIISDGEADILLGFEPAETLRALKRCNPKTVVITNTAPLPPFTVAIGKGIYPEIETICKLLRERTASLIDIDAAALAKEAGNVLAVNMVLLGALTATGILPVTPESIESAIEKITRSAFIETNIKAFEMGRKVAG